MSSVDEETQKLMDSYIKFGKKIKLKVEIGPFPGFIPITGFLVLLNGASYKKSNYWR